MPTADEKLSKLNDRLDAVYTVDLPDIKVRLEQVHGTQNLILEKIEGVEKGITKIGDQHETFSKDLISNTFRVAALEAKEVTHSESWKAVRGFFGKILVGVIVALTGYAIGHFLK